jgi:hypothetical protein
MLRASLKFSLECVLGLSVGQIAATLLAAAAEPKTEDHDFFEKKIRPVLVERCYKCHSAKAEKLKGDLLLDTKEGTLKGGESGKPAVVPGDAERSLLIEAIRYGNEDLQMPPKKEGRLTEEQIADFVAWINKGAPDPRSGKSGVRSQKSEVRKHWAFQPPKDPPIPQVKNKSWPKTSVDHFILAKLEEKGLQPAPPADMRTLIRRATFDLTGLPPTPDEVEAFLKDKSPEAFARVVDRLLSSQRYGERWGRYWLDVARYADTKGYVYTDREEGRFVQSYAYRDWVIRALNEDMPYAKFLKLQVAADQIVRGEDRRDLAAMGFLTLGRRFLGVVHDIIDDRIDVVMRGAQGLTVGCARCHDHKYDPIPTKDYYSLYGVFHGSSERALPLVNDLEHDATYAEFLKGLREREEKLEQTFRKKCDELSERLRNKTTDYLLAVLEVDKLPTEEFYAIRGPDDLNPAIVRQWDMYLLQNRKEFHPVFALWHSFAGFPAKDFSVHAKEIIENAVKAKESSIADNNRLNELVLRAFATNTPTSMQDVARRYGELLVGAHKAWREALKDAEEKKLPAPTVFSDAMQEELRQALYAPDSPVLVPRGAIVDLEWFFDEAGRVELAKLQAEIDRWIIKSASPPYAVILEDRATQRNPRVFVRGNPANKGDEVPRRFLEVLAGSERKPFTKGSGRLELANAIASKENPLTARVMVNRVWLHHFGSGLVRTPSDFGTRCESPTHPELLDWLSRYFMNEDWSLKKLHRLIMLSAVYQQSSDVTATSSTSQIDPENRLLWHFNRQRLDFETMRDSLLAVSGELDVKTGGKPVEMLKKPFSTRRTVYGFIDRQFLPGVLRVFDFANPDMHSPQRLETTVPQQALFFMNSPFVTERARALTDRDDVRALKKPEQRIEQLHRIAYQRLPTADQLQLGKRFVKAAEALPPREPSKPVISPWQYGYGEYDEAAQRVRNFEPLPHFTGEAWQGGANWPDPKLGWVQLTAEGGHAGNDLQHAAIRRWVAPADGKITLSGEIKHEHKEGDGIRARIVSSRAGQLGNWTLQNKNEKTNVESVEVQGGDTIDFVVDYHANLNSDDFKWAPVIKRSDVSGGENSAEYGREWNARKEFGGPPEKPAKPLTPWEQYTQVLLLSNEFMFVD